MECPSCSADASRSDRFCRSCGTALGSPSELATRLAEPGEALAVPLAAAPAVGRLISSGSVPLGGFAPGNVLARRYRIIGLLGRGGMGDVYRADDLKLGQPVALKFLPSELAADPVRRERFFAEVRIARQVSHPNICRVYDIGEMEGRHFLTMEYVDGEDLASLLKRIGSLHGGKALDVTRQLCAGLAAAHDKGVLHRDLKPANVMLDGRGHVRVTDFGLAVAAGDDAAAEMSGTPAYMAPEQLAGKGASVRSDIYALGLVLYEIYTGRRGFRATTLAELREEKEGGTPPAPSEIARDIDPIVERVIQRCLERDPRQRPVSVAHVMAALPGGDPLAAALAAGETPSPEMVAASGARAGLRPAVAGTLLAAVALGLGSLFVLAPHTFLLERVRVDRPPDALQETARDILRQARLLEGPADSVWGLAGNEAYFAWAQGSRPVASLWRTLPASAVQFWYRQSPRAIGAWSFPPTITARDPVLTFSDEAAIVLDARGRLTDLDVVPPQRDVAVTPKGGTPGAATTAPQWQDLFARAGLDSAKFAPAEPTWTPLHFADTRAAWTGAHPDLPDVPVRIEAASYRGRPVSWHLIAPWDEPQRMAQPASAATRGLLVIFISVALATAAGGILFARRNLRMGRGDRRGAARLAVWAFAMSALAWLTYAHHVADVREFQGFAIFISIDLLATTMAWVLYIAFEPHVRRRWPHLLVGWSRVLAGEFRDPLVGRDLLVGCALGVAWLPFRSLFEAVAVALGSAQERPLFPGNAFGTTVRFAVNNVTGDVLGAVRVALVATFLLFLLRTLLRRQWIAVAAFVLLLSAVSFLTSAGPVGAICSAVYFTAGLLLLIRFGLLAFAAAGLASDLTIWMPPTPQLSAWYAGTSIVGTLVLLGLAAYGFYTSLGGQPLFGQLTMDD